MSLARPSEEPKNYIILITVIKKFLVKDFSLIPSDRYASTKGISPNLFRIYSFVNNESLRKYLKQYPPVLPSGRSHNNY